jgi:hypothetical protein
MPGLLDLLAPGATANQPTSGTDFMSMLQGPQALSPMMAGNGFNPASPQTPQAAPPSLMTLLQGMFGVKPPASSPPYDDPNFNAVAYQPSTEQLMRMKQLSQLFPQSRNIIDRRNALEAYPQQPLPIPQMGQGVMQSMINNSAWPRPNLGPMQRYGPQ